MNSRAPFCAEALRDAGRVLEIDEEKDALLEDRPLIASGQQREQVARTDETYNANDEDGDHRDAEHGRQGDRDTRQDCRPLLGRSQQPGRQQDADGVGDDDRQAVESRMDQRVEGPEPVAGFTVDEEDFEDADREADIGRDEKRVDQRHADRRADDRADADEAERAD